MNKSDSQLKQDIETELAWDPMINAAQIGVTVDKGGVTLRGDIDTYAEKWAAEAATKRVAGVRVVAQDLKVRVPFDGKHSDADISSAVSNALKWDVFVPNAVGGTVHEGAVTLTGMVDWNYERDSAERAVRYLGGVTAVYNSITLKPGNSASAEMVKEKVLAALQRQARTDAKSIKVETSGGKVTLSGHTSSWQGIEDATSAAWAAPGVTEVIQHINIE